MLGVPVSNMETMRQMNNSELYNLLRYAFDVDLKGKGVTKVHNALEALASVQNPTQAQIEAALKKATLKVKDETMQKLLDGIQEVLDASSGQEEE